ncbi:hypothetical protein [Myceligenerans pegani]|uniref:Uncharacterized protein n=1 Tax=Myceligenerans pegani TaxID=2776917 RepID=A0ABR9MV08_9MICO|nr:hypothetical protein [Myceligenerans sp. TRM 65318]MBE1874836.1 hypothetical protein [Myceligenerans sp. TRM 65318]MBE3017107.1 hypothetical protein [Myceligenerans sp. TRM 65318]
MATETTRQTNRKVVEALERAARVADEAIASWAQVRDRLEDAWDASGLHKDLGEESWAVYTTMSASRGRILQRLDAERDGDKR